MRMGFAALVALLLGGCQWSPTPVPDGAPVPWQQPGPEAATLPQNWDDRLSSFFHYTPQGSRLMPRAWFVAIERADGQGLFADPANLSRYGLLYAADAGTGLNPDRLPIGFAIDPVPQAATGNWVGLTCAACHTGEVAYRGTRLRVEGAPASFDYDRFVADLDAAVQAVRRDPARLERLAARLGTTPAALAEPFGTYAARSAAHMRAQAPAVVSGFSRVDALGQIINALAITELDAAPEVKAANAQAPRAPVSYPPIWLTPALDWVQYAPVAASPIGRNAGEVMGVFGRVNLSGPGPRRFESSVLYRDLHALENWVSTLQPPRWPEARFGAIDRVRWEEGQRIFRANCQACHNMPPFRRTEARDSTAGEQYIRVSAVPQRVVGTDASYGQAIASRSIDPGPLADLFDGRRGVPAAEYFGHTVQTVVLDNLQHDAPSTRELVDSGELRGCPGGLRGTINANRPRLLRYEVPSPCIVPRGGPIVNQPRKWVPPSSSWAALKAGPLLGTWATGPYLHNGSVPTIYDLLSPENERPAVFWVGGRELDVQRLGFVSAEAPGLFRYDTALPGNSNRGHNFPGRALAPAQRYAVIEYLKDPLRFDEGGLR